MRRAQEWKNKELKERFKAEDEREAARVAGKRQLVANHRIASLQATKSRQDLIDKLSNARSRAALEKLQAELSGVASVSGATPATLATAEVQRPESARAQPRPPDVPRAEGAPPPRPSSARARLA